MDAGGCAVVERAAGLVRSTVDGTTSAPDRCDVVLGGPGSRAGRERRGRGFTRAPQPRLATPTQLYDALSSVQRGLIKQDNKDRLTGDAATRDGGALPVTNSKVRRAAADLGMAPEDWFALAGC